MKALKRITVVCVAIIFLIALVPVSAFAVDPVSFSEAEILGATIVDLYGAYNNTSLAYDQMSSSGALTEIVTLYNNYSQSASDPYTLAAIGAAAAAAGAVAVIYDAITGQGYVQLYQEQYVSSMDGYWDYQLTDAGLVRDSITGLFGWTLDNNDNIQPITVFSESSISINGNPLNPLPVTAYYGDRWETLSSSSNLYALVYTENDPTWSDAILITLDNSSFSYTRSWSNDTPVSNNSQLNDGWNTVRVGFDHYYVPVNVSLSTYIPGGSITDYLGLASDLSNNLISTSSEIAIHPSEFIGDPLENPLEITIPNPSSPDYSPEPKRITTNIPWNPDWGDPLPDGVYTPEYGVPYSVTDPSILNEAVPEIWSEIVANGVEIQDAPEPVQPGPDPSEVYIPLLPVTLPSFNFSFSGIWHYVVTWVGSLGSWLTLMFSMWSALPYAIVVPVYATAVIVIVIGTLKRFL